MICLGKLPLVSMNQKEFTAVKIPAAPPPITAMWYCGKSTHTVLKKLHGC